MTRRVLSFVIGTKTEFTVMLPALSPFLGIRQVGVYTMVYFESRGGPNRRRTFTFFSTFETIPDGYSFRGVHVHDEEVWLLYERVKSETRDPADEMDMDDMEDGRDDDWRTDT